MNLPDSNNKLPEYSFMGKNLDELFIYIRDYRGGVLGGLPDFCARLYRLVFDEGLGLIEALDELGRQTGGQLYSTTFYSDLVEGIDGDIHTDQNGPIFTQNLISVLTTLKNRII